MRQSPPGEGHRKMKVEIGFRKLQARECQELLAAREAGRKARGTFPPQPPEGTNRIETLISDRERVIFFVCVNSPVSGNFLRQL